MCTRNQEEIYINTVRVIWKYNALFFVFVMDIYHDIYIYFQLFIAIVKCVSRIEISSVSERYRKISIAHVVFELKRILNR